MKRYKQTAGSVVTISRNFQITFIVTAVLGTLIGHISFLLLITRAENAYLPSEFWWTQGAYAIFPVTMVAIAYLFSKYASLLHRVFNAVLRAIIGFMVFQVLSTVHNYVVSDYMQSADGVAPSWLLSPWNEVLLMGITLFIFLVAQYWWLQRSRRR
jgi:hypothetical protein